MQFLSLKRNLLISTLIAITLGAWGVPAQVGTTSIRDVMTDKTEAMVSNTRVSLTNTGQALTREMNTNNTNEYEFLALPPGTYSLNVKMQNFRKFENKNIQLLV